MKFANHHSEPNSAARVALVDGPRPRRPPEKKEEKKKKKKKGKKDKVLFPVFMTDFFSSSSFFFLKMGVRRRLPHRTLREARRAVT